MIDLSMSISAAMPTNRPDHFPPAIRAYAQIDRDGWVGSELTLDSHCGTHVDAPAHFIAGGATVDQIPLEFLMGTCQVRHVKSGSGTIMSDDLGPVHAPRVLIATGCADHAESDPDRYFSSHRYLSADAAQHLVDSGVRMVGIDCPSVDAPDSDTAHQILLRNNVVIVENMVNLSTLPELCEVAVLPLRIEGGDGSPARAVAHMGGAS